MTSSASTMQFRQKITVSTGCRDWHSLFSIFYPFLGLFSKTILETCLISYLKDWALVFFRPDSLVCFCLTGSQRSLQSVCDDDLPSCKLPQSAIRSMSLSCFLVTLDKTAVCLLFSGDITVPFLLVCHPLSLILQTRATCSQQCSFLQ